MITISQKALKLIKNITLLTAILPMIAWADAKVEMSNPSSQKITLRMALTRAEHSKGLSGLKPKDFTNQEGMLFINDSVGPRKFWMPDTYFKLDIIFLDPDLKIVGIEKNVPFHPTEIEPPVIYRTKTYDAQYILETNSGAPFSKKLKVGDKLKWLGSSSLSEIALKTRPQR